jgi:hypothetical protein
MAYEGLTEEETKILEADEAAQRGVTTDESPAIPPSGDNDDKSPSVADVLAEKGVNPDGTKATPPAASAPAGEQTPPAGGAAPDARFAAFLEQHKGKTPEQLLELAYQQTGRANGAEARGRQSREQLEGFTKRAQEVIADRRAKREAIAGKRQKFKEQLETDPDAATRDMHEEMLSKEEAELLNEERTVAHEAAFAQAAIAFPDIDRAALTEFGGQLNYSPEEISGVTDVRDLATLQLASLSGRLLMAGIIDIRGNLLAAPQAVEATDPRLTPPPAPATLSSAPARSSEQVPTVHKQLQDIHAMSTKELDAWERQNPGMLEKLLRAAENG